MREFLTQCGNGKRPRSLRRSLRTQVCRCVYDLGDRFDYSRRIMSRCSLLSLSHFVVHSTCPLVQASTHCISIKYHRSPALRGRTKIGRCSMIDTLKNIESIVCVPRSYLFGGALYFGGPLRPLRSIRGGLFSRRLMKFLQGYSPLSLPSRLPFPRRG